MLNSSLKLKYFPFVLQEVIFPYLYQLSLWDPVFANGNFWPS